jgi:hypothetical protein
MRLPHRITGIVMVALLCAVYSCSKETKIPDAAIVPESATATATSTATTSTAVTTSTQSTTVTQPNAPSVALATGNFKTQNVIIIVMDGARWSETWGDYTRSNIPNMFSMYSQGVLLGNFRNNGTTLTDSGHDAICTGNYEYLENSGQELPQYPSIFQNFLKATGKPQDKTWVIASKDKLAILGNCKQGEWAGQFMPKLDCGVNGLFTGYRSDDTTFNHAKNVLLTYHPNLMLINFKDPDVYGHGNQWGNYVNAIKKTDQYIKDLYDLIQNDPQYKDKTTVFITNDHGRHLDGVGDGVSNGFISHGCGCEGCRHIQMLALGPDFKKGLGSDLPYEQIDIAPTIAKMLNFKMDYAKGKVMTDLFR